MKIKTVSIIGANGTMGKNVAAIFASFGNAKVYMICRDIEKAEKSRKDAFMSIRSESIYENLIPMTYNDLPQCISDSDLIFESLCEDFEVKFEMYLKIKSYVKPNAIIATGTSGISITELSKAFGENSKNFFGIHMFNPPYNLSLCELICHNINQEELSLQLREYLSKYLKRTVVKTSDSPSFLGNRIGFFFINESLKLAEENYDEGGVEYIDSIIGCFTGRSMSPMVTADFVGLDVTKSIVDYIHNNISDSFSDCFECTEILNFLVAENKLGRKVRYGLYYRNNDNKKMYVYDAHQQNYFEKANFQFKFANEMISFIKIGDYKKAFLVLINDESHEALICKKMLLKYILYSLKISYEVCNDISACDDAMVTGFSWIPPIALIDLIGGIEVLIKLSKKYLDKKFIDIVENQNIIEKIPSQSKYDYRPFLKARY